MKLFGRAKKRISFVKTVELTREGWETRYSTEVNGCYVSNSLSVDKETAEKFYESVLILNGATKVKETLREAYR